MRLLLLWLFGPPPPGPSVHFPLSLAYICLDCEAVFRCVDYSACPACASDSVTPLRPPRFKRPTARVA